jgi:hypothetical protein
MKKLILSFLAVAFISLVSQAQISFGVRTGGGLQNITGTDRNGEKLSNKVVPAFNAGVNIEFPLTNEIYLQPGLFFTKKGAIEENEILGIETKSKIHLSYFEVPVNILFKPFFGNGRLLIGFGPCLAFGISGKVKSETEIPGVITVVEKEVEFAKSISSEAIFDNVEYYRRLDAGANLLFGYEFVFGLSVQIYTQFGLSDINPQIEGSDQDESKGANTGYGISASYRFNFN